MKRISKLLVLFFGITSITAIAQNADSVIVIYQNQKTIIPLPAFGSQTSASYADSNKVVEIGVWVRKPGEPSPFPQLSSGDITNGKTRNKSKWFSQVEAGYTISVPSNNSYSYYETGNFQGYKLVLSIREKERNIKGKIAFISGFKLGYDQSFRNVNTQENGQSPVYRSSFFQILFPFAFNNHFTAFGLPANVSIGANMIYGYYFNTRKNNFNTESLYDNSLFFLEPYIGFEINKLGLRIGSSRSLAPEMSFNNPVKSVNSISLTYRFF